MANQIEDHTEELEEEPFYFESDHLALRDNPDYNAVLKTLAILQAQKIQALQDIDKIVQAELIALQDPDEFVAKLSRGEQLDVPKRIDILDVSLSCITCLVNKSILVLESLQDLKNHFNSVFDQISIV